MRTRLVARLHVGTARERTRAIVGTHLFTVACIAHHIVAPTQYAHLCAIFRVRSAARHFLTVRAELFRVIGL